MGSAQSDFENIIVDGFGDKIDGPVFKAFNRQVHVTVAGRPFVPVRDSVDRIVAHIQAVAAEVARAPVDSSPRGRVKSEEHRRELVGLYRRAAESYRQGVAAPR